jgi:hypothetical protein
MKRVMFSFLIVFAAFALFAGFTQQQKIKNSHVRQWSGVDVVNNGNAVGFSASAYDLAYNRIIEPVLYWHTFLGGSISYDSCEGIAIDGSGNIYVTGTSNYSWGSPVNPFTGSVETPDAFVAKLSPSGVLQWNTFLGGSGWDSGSDIVIDGNGNIYVTGVSASTWGSPVNPFGGGDNDAFVARLNSNGVRQWNTFLGGSDFDWANGIEADGSGNIFVIGSSESTWGSPVNPFSGEDNDAFVARLNANGARQWHTFLGGSYDDYGTAIVTDLNGNIYVTGTSDVTWGSPVNPHAEGWVDAFVAKLNANGARQWNTFLGGSDFDWANGIEADGSGNIFVIGSSESTWGSPVNPFVDGYGYTDAFVARLNSNGVRQWNTFLGGNGLDNGLNLVTDGSENIYVSGYSQFTWGNPVNPFSGGDTDAFVARLNSNGVRQWHTFLGGSGWDFGYDIVTDGSGNIYVTGYSTATWGNPVNPFAGRDDALVARLIDVDAPPYEITLNRENLYFASTGNVSTSSQTFLVSSNSSNPVVPIWFISGDQTWLSCNPTNGTGPCLVTVSVNPTGLAAGTYAGIITVTDPIAVNSPQTINVTFNVYSPGQTIEPFGQYSTPADGTLVSGSVPFTGWALDDIGVESVKIYRLEGSNLIYIGDAVFIEGAQPDVELAYPGFPMNYRAGWGYMMLTNFLPNSGNGLFTIEATATDLEGNQVTLGTKTITVDNANAVKPFGAIDTPGQGGSASGSSYRNWGWVLTPQPNLIPTNGSTIGVWLDGVNLGHPIYNIYRPDVAALFPGYGNMNGAGGYFDIDTTAYTNGVHSISWTATDSGGNTDGMGSRYFSILNTGSSQVSAVNTRRSTAPGFKDIIDIPLSYVDPVELKKGYNDSYLAEQISPDIDGIVHIQCQELERIELLLSYAGNKVEGYLLVGQRLKRLPIGSTLGSRTGTFSWIPGPGFVGTYRLVFVETDENGEQSRKEIMVTIVPRGAAVGNRTLRRIISE